MPVYVFKCTECGAEKEVICKHEDRPEVVECDVHWRATPGNKRMTMVPALSVASFIVNGFNEKNGYSGGTQ